MTPLSIAGLDHLPPPTFHTFDGNVWTAGVYTYRRQGALATFWYVKASVPRWLLQPRENYHPVLACLNTENLQANCFSSFAPVGLVFGIMLHMNLSLDTQRDMDLDYISTYHPFWGDLGTPTFSGPRFTLGAQGFWRRASRRSARSMLMWTRWAMELRHSSNCPMCHRQGAKAQDKGWRRWRRVSLRVNHRTSGKTVWMVLYGGGLKLVTTNHV